MNKVLFMSSILPTHSKEWIVENSIGAISNANDNFQRAIIDGLILNGLDVSLLNVPNIGAFPIRFRKAYVPSFGFREYSVSKGFNIGFFNFIKAKHFFIYKNTFKYLKNHLDEIDTILVYDLSYPFLKAIRGAKKIKRDLKVVIIIPDIYGFTGYDKNFIHRLLTYNEENNIYKNLNFIDGFILLTKTMLEKLPAFVNDKPVDVMEGILNSAELNTIKHLPSSPKKIIMYTGSLDTRHGILNLIDAFLKGNFDAELHIYGDGNGKQMMMEKIKDNTLIKYFGQRSRDEIIIKQKEAFLLINPRTSEGEFTRYSFPSKIIEYFASGTPTLMYRLDGIPDEYYKYCFTPNDESVTSLTMKLNEILNIDENSLNDLGQRAKKFVFENKNSKVQTKKIIQLFNQI